MWGPDRLTVTAVQGVDVARNLVEVNNGVDLTNSQRAAAWQTPEGVGGALQRGDRKGRADERSYTTHFERVRRENEYMLRRGATKRTGKYPIDVDCRLQIEVTQSRTSRGGRSGLVCWPVIEICRNELVRLCDSSGDKLECR